MKLCHENYGWNVALNFEAGILSLRKQEEVYEAELAEREGLYSTRQ